MRRNDPKYTVKVATLPKSPNVTVGKPGKVVTSAMRAKVAFPMTGGTSMGAGGNFYSPELSPDFLELPQSVDEQRNYYRFFYDHDPFVGQAIDIHGELPLSKLRLRKPRAKNKALAEASMRFCERWVRKIGLLQRLLSVVHEYFLIGEVFAYAEDTSPEMPKEVTHENYKEITSDGKVVDEWRPLPEAEARKRSVEWLKKNYSGWTGLRVLPPEQIHMESFPFTDERLIELIPDNKTKALIERAMQGDIRALKIVETYPPEVVHHVRLGTNIPLNTNPMAGSFVHYIARKKSDYEPRGKSILQRCLRVLVYRDKLRQAQTSIASRHMTPIRVVWAEDMNAEQTEELREQVDLALQDPDFSIIANFQVNWEEMGGGQGNRLLELSGEYDLTDRQLYAGLGVTESLLSGESSYSGDRIHLEVINVRYLLLRELLQDFVDKHLLEPMCRRMGFIEYDEDGHEVVISPRLSFTRLALRDNQETFDQCFNLYQKGSLDIDTILDLLNIDPDTVREKLERDFGTFNDATFNELLRSLYSRAGDAIVENSDFVDQMAERIHVTYSKPKEEGMSRFASAQENPLAVIKNAVQEAMHDHFKHDRPIEGPLPEDDRVSALEQQLADIQAKLAGLTG
jgi:hypothetical protein